MKLVFTAHARYRMGLRGISEDMVGQAIDQPDRRGHGYGGRELAFKRVGQETLKVVHVLERDTRVIITVMWEYPEEG